MRHADQNQWQFLIQAGSEIEANIIESFLQAEGIPVVKKYRESGEYLVIYTGMTNFGIDIYVPAEHVTQALAALEQIDGEEEDEQFIEE